MRSRRLASAAALALVLCATVAGQTQAQTTVVVPRSPPAKPEKTGSLYVQCDGEPNNVTGGETAARLLGAVTLLGIFARPHEAADPKLRKLGAAGIAACTTLIDSEQREGNVRRRIPLILGRALHRIEAKDYSGAIADVDLARHEAEAAGFLADPYYLHSQGRSFDLITAAALFRAGKPGQARDVALRGLRDTPFLPMPVISVPRYLLLDPAPSETEAAVRAANLRNGWGGDLYAARLEEWGRFADAATIREAMVDSNKRVMPDARSTAQIAQSAITLALAGDTDRSDASISEARANADKRRANGDPDSDASDVIELFDLHAILRMSQRGDMAGARRLFAGRSQWVAASFGSVVEINRRLRAGAAPAELIGGLGEDPAGLWKAHLETERTKVLAKDDDNRTLFLLMDEPTAAAAYRSISKLVWRTDKSKLLVTLKDKDQERLKLKMERMYAPDLSLEVALPAYTLHAALLAKARGHQGFVLRPTVGRDVVAMAFLTGNKGDPGFAAPIFIEADEAIKALSAVIPSPETIAAEEKVKR